MTREVNISLEAAAPWIAGLVLGLPLFATDAPPMADYAAHEAIVHVMRHMHDVTQYPAGLYAWNLGHPNQLFHLASYALSFALGVPLACRVVIASSLIAILVSIARLAKYVGKTRWVALVCAPLALGWTFYWGLVANLIGLACLFFALPSFDAFAARPSVRGAAKCAAWMFVLYLAHEGLLFAGAGFLGLLLVVRLSRETIVKAALLSLLPFGVAVGTIVGQWFLQAPLRSPANLSLPTRWPSWSFKLTTCILDVGLGPDDSLAPRTAFIVLLVATAVVFWLRRTRGARDGAGLRAALVRWRWALLAASSFVVYLVLPDDVQGASLIYQRYLAPALVLFVITIAPAADRWPAFASAIVSAIPLVSVATSFPQYVIAARLHGDLEEILPHIEEGSAVANLDFNPGAISRIFYPQESARVVTERGGRVLYSFFDSPIAPVMIAKPCWWTDAVMRHNRRVADFEPAFDLRRFKYVLVFTADEPIVDVVPFVLAPEATFVAKKGPWMLFESHVTVDSPTAPEPPPPSPAPETLDDRRKRLTQ